MRESNSPPLNGMLGHKEDILAEFPHTKNQYLCRSHYSVVQNKQEKQPLPVQQPQLADKK